MSSIGNQLSILNEQMSEIENALAALKSEPLVNACRRWEARVKDMEEAKQRDWRLAPHLPPLDPEDRLIAESLFQTAQFQRVEIERQIRQIEITKTQLESRFEELKMAHKRLNIFAITNAMSAPMVNNDSEFDVNSIQKSLIAGRQSVYQAKALLEITEGVLTA